MTFSLRGGICTWAIAAQVWSEECVTNSYIVQKKSPYTNTSSQGEDRAKHFFSLTSRLSNKKVHLMRSMTLLACFVSFHQTLICNNRGGGGVGVPGQLHNTTM